jgi:hypothetical protein
MRSVQVLPLIRAFFHSRDGCPQARLPAHPGTFPGNDILGTRGGEFCWIEVGHQKRRIQIALHRPDATSAVMKPRRVRLWGILTTAVTVLGELGGLGGNLVQGAARTRPRCVSTSR